MSYITHKRAVEVLRENPYQTLNDFIQWAQKEQPSWNKNEPRFMARMHSLYAEAQAVLVNEEMQAAEEYGEELAGTIDSPEARRERATGKTFVFTSAQSNTKVHDKFFEALLRYCEANGAALHISRFTYNKNGLGANDSKVGSEKSSDGQDVWFDPRIEPFCSDSALQITDDLVWCGELNILPTRVNPLSGFENYSRDASCVIPHAKMFMQSVPTMKHAPAKFIYTTGACTLRNYIQRAAGQKADFHHVFGAIVVEVDDDGTWWARQLNADKEGGFYDLTTYWTAEGPRGPHMAEAITHGDLHGFKLDMRVAEAVWGDNGIVDALRPRLQFFHDTIDFMPRNHHNIKDPHFLHEVHVKGKEVVEDEFKFMGHFLANVAYRQYSTSFIVVSNHDQAIMQWLRNTAAFYDPPNARFWCELNHYVMYQQENKRKPHPFKHAMSTAFKAHSKGAGMTRKMPVFLLEDDSYKILGEIEAGLHGHLGPNGARGNPKNLKSAGKVNSGHTHSAGIFEGVYTAGVYGQLDMGYNKGLSSWSHSLIVTYPNAKRAILTIKKGKAWRCLEQS